VRVAMISAVALIGISGCARAPESYPIPAQYQPVSGPEQLSYDHFVRAADPDARSYFIKDVRDLEGDFRWTLANPEFRFFLKRTEGLRFKLEFGVNSVTLRDVGPLEFTIEINDHLLGKVHETTPGLRSFEAKVPAAWLTPNEDAIVRMRVSNPWPARKETDLGFVFYAAGFVE
jgi:hypothetical protein